jgi:hypothetical protein
VNVATFCAGAAVALTVAARTDSVVVVVSAMISPINAAASRPMTIPSLVGVVVDRFVTAVNNPVACL